MRGRNSFGIALLIILLIAVGSLLLYRSGKLQGTLIFSPPQMLGALWNEYKEEYVAAGTYRTIDTGRGDVTTSEGESYTMLRAVWMDDKQTFDESWQWTQQNLQRPDYLFSWLWGEEQNGTYGILTAQNGETTASDADQDIALSLIFAYARWQDPSYLDAARNIIKSIWQNEVVIVQGEPYLAADNLEKTETGPWIAVDPSYFSPAAYPLFAEVDPSDPWNELANTSFAVLQASLTSSLGSSGSAELPPDWIGLNRTTGAIAPLGASTTTMPDTNFGYDALRVPWRLALDWEWFGDPRAKSILQQLSFLGEQWSKNGSLATVYSHSGNVVTGTPSPAMYGGSIGYFLVIDPSVAQTIYQEKLASMFDPATNTWQQPLSYYDDNWAWFGLGLYNNLLPNLATQIPTSTLQTL